MYYVRHCMLFYLNLPHPTLPSRYYHFHFIDEDSEAKREEGKLTSLRPQSMYMEEPELEPRLVWLRRERFPRHFVELTLPSSLTGGRETTLLVYHSRLLPTAFCSN